MSIHSKNYAADIKSLAYSRKKDLIKRKKRSKSSRIPKENWIKNLREGLKALI